MNYPEIIASAHFRNGSIVENLHTRDQRTITATDVLPPAAVADSELSQIVYVLTDGARWNQTQLKQHWTGSCSPRPTRDQGYRDLKAGEMLQEGDEYWNPRHSEWQKYIGRPLVIGCVYAPFQYRRSISSAQ